MEHAYEASTVEMDHTGYNDLQEQLLNNKSHKSDNERDIRQKSPVNESKRELSNSSKKYFFTKGDQSLELDDDYEIEFMADKRPTRLTLRELKERAAGDIAVKNRMHSLAEEKKRIQSTFREFSELAKTDPLGALEFISNKVNESDSEFEYSNYIQKLGEQAEKLGQMDEKERKALELEKKLEKAERDLSHKEIMQSVALRKQEMLDSYPEIGNQQFGDMVNAVLANEDLLEGLEDEDDIMDRVEELIIETLTQKDIISVIEEINPDYSRDNSLIFSLSDQLRQNPDLDEEDVRDIIREIIGQQKAEPVRNSRNDSRQRDAQILSRKARQGMPERDLRSHGASDFEVLAEKLKEKHKEIHKTPVYMR